MEVSPKTLREVEFREKKMGGYHPEDVDNFLEQVAVGLELMQDRLRQAVERAQRAEAAAAEAGGSDETLRKTLILAQRTADMAVQEAREQASRILGGAEQQAQATIAEAEERGRLTLEDAVLESRAELARLEGIRAQAQQDVETLQRWIDEHKSHVQAALGDAIESVNRVGVLWPAPNTAALDVPAPSRASSGNNAAADQGSAPSAADAADPASPGPETEIWNASLGDEFNGSESTGSGQSFAPPLQPGVVDVRPDLVHGMGPDERAMDDFFDDAADLDDERRFGSRLRRRR